MRRVGLPPGGSTLMTSAPNPASVSPQYSACSSASSMTRMPVSGPRAGAVAVKPEDSSPLSIRTFGARQTLQCRGPDDPQPVPVVLDLHRHASFEYVIEHTIDICAQLGRREASRISHDGASDAYRSRQSVRNATCIV